MDIYCCLWYLFWIFIFNHFLEHFLYIFHGNYINTCCCGDVVRTFLTIDLFLFRCRLVEGFHLIDEFLHFFMYNAINHGVYETWCSRCWLIIETIFLLLGPEWGKVCICFIDIYFFAPGFECFSENYGCMHVVISEAKKFTVIDYFIAFFCKVFFVVEMLKEVSDWCGWIPTYSHAIEIDFEVGGGDGSVLSV